MSNRYMQQFIYSFLKMFKKVIAEIPLSAAAAVGTVYAPGIASVTKSGTGQYTVVFQDQYVKYMGAHLQVQAAVPVSIVVQVLSYVPATRTLVFSTLAGATPVDVSAAIVIYMEANFRDSTVAQ